MQKSIRIQPVTRQDSARKLELQQRTPAERMRMIFTLIDRSAKQTRLARIATVRHVSF